MSHTPGPWIFCGNHVDDSQGVSLVRSTRTFGDLNCADIHLIAAAPDLLEACQMCDHFLSDLLKDGDHVPATGVDDLWDLLAKSREALSKAKRTQ